MLVLRGAGGAVREQGMHLALMPTWGGDFGFARLLPRLEGCGAVGQSWGLLNTCFQFYLWSLLQRSWGSCWHLKESVYTNSSGSAGGAHGNYPKLLGPRMHHITKSGRPAVLRVLSSRCTCCSITTKLKMGTYLLRCKTCKSSEAGIVFYHGA